ncbi:MAG: inositol monophosphatase, partial [Opitutales bacterium]
RDLVVAVMTELPTSKAGAADRYSAVRGGGVQGERIDLRTGRRTGRKPRPSRARGVAHGFASLAKFFPEGKAWLATLEEKLWRELEPRGAAHGRPVFDDQYISTGGQLHELLAGHDRFIADLRPLVPRRAGGGNSLPCHPYDICPALIAEEAGCVITGPDGGPLRAPLDTTTPVAWIGYANPALARRIGPVLRRLLKKQGGVAERAG